MLLPISEMNAQADTPPCWHYVQSVDKWWYEHADGSYTTNDWEKINGKWYHFDSSGWMQSGRWLKDNGTWYYLNSSGAMRTGWLKYNNKWYYLNTDGGMRTGWLKANGVWYYLDDTGTIVYGLQQIGTLDYYFDENGIMQTGWKELDGNTYYFEKDGRAVYGFYHFDNDPRFSYVDYYYFYPNGIMAKGWVDIPNVEGLKLYFGTDGTMQRNKYVDGVFLNIIGRQCEYNCISFEKNVIKTDIVYYQDDEKSFVKNTTDSEWISAFLEELAQAPPADWNDFKYQLFERRYEVTVTFEDGLSKAFSVYFNSGTNKAFVHLNYIVYEVDLNAINAMISEMLL